MEKVTDYKSLGGIYNLQKCIKQANKYKNVFCILYGKLIYTNTGPRGALKHALSMSIRGTFMHLI